MSDGADMLDHYAVTVRVGPKLPEQNFEPSARFIANDASAEVRLENAAAEFDVVREWSERFRMTLAQDEPQLPPSLTLLHISTHGQRDIGNGTSILWLHDRPLLSFLASSRIVAETVIINACDSAAKSEHALSQSTIAAGFLRAGTQNVVATLFPISDNAALAFSQVFYRNYTPGTDDVARAVRAAQLDLRRKRFSPFAWAAYVVTSARLH
jgi:CHAT domain-containing protein